LRKLFGVRKEWASSFRFSGSAIRDQTFPSNSYRLCRVLRDGTSYLGLNVDIFFLPPTRQRSNCSAG
jgi:hypothetical protein